MGLFKRLVIALEKIAEFKMITQGEIIIAMDAVMKNMMQQEYKLKQEQQQDYYHWLKEKQAKDILLTDSEKNHILWGDKQAKEGYFKAYTGA